MRRHFFFQKMNNHIYRAEKISALFFCGTFLFYKIVKNSGKLSLLLKTRINALLPPYNVKIGGDGMEKWKQKLLQKQPMADLPMVILVITLVLFGLVMLFSASYAVGSYRFQDPYTYIRPQAVFAEVGLIAL